MATKLAPGSRKGVGHSSSQQRSNRAQPATSNRARLPQGGRAFVVSTTVESGATGDVEPRRTSERAGRSPAAVAFRRSPPRPPRLPVFRLPHIETRRTSERAGRSPAFPPLTPLFPPRRAMILCSEKCRQCKHTASILRLPAPSMPLSPACSAMLCTHSIDAEPAFAPSAPVLHRSCIVPAPVQHPCCIAPASMLARACILLHRCSTRAAPVLHRSCIAPAPVQHPCCIAPALVLHRSCIDACVCLHSPASLLHPCCIDACICLHPPASMLAYACIRLHRCLHMLAFACIDACICLHSPASMLAYACVCLHSPASMLTHACIRLHRCLRMLAFACIDAYACLHSPASMLAFACIDACIRLHRCLRMLAFACIDAYACLHSPASMLAFACIEPNRPKAKRAGSFDSLTRESSRRARRVTAREERERGRTSVPPPSSFVLSSPSR